MPFSQNQRDLWIDKFEILKFKEQYIQWNLYPKYLELISSVDESVRPKFTFPAKQI